MTVCRRSSVCMPIAIPPPLPKTPLSHAKQRVQSWCTLPSLSTTSPSLFFPTLKSNIHSHFRFSPRFFFFSSSLSCTSASCFPAPFASCTHAIRGMHDVLPPSLSSPLFLSRPSSPSLRCTVSNRAFSVRNLFAGKAKENAAPASSASCGTSFSFPASTTGIKNGAPRENGRDATLLQEDAMATLQDRLLDTCVQILEMCGGYADGRPPRSEIDSLSRDVLFDLVDAVLHDYKKTPADQFELLYAAFCLPAAQTYAFLRTPLMTILECVTPPPFCQYLRGVDVFLPNFDEESMIRRAALLRFARVLMGDLEYLRQVGVVEKEEEEEGGGDAVVHDGASSSTPASTTMEKERWKIEKEEVVVHAIVQDFKKCFPLATRGQAFLVLERRALDIALQSKLYALLGQLCVEMDREQTGKVSLNELDAMARRVLGKEKAASLLRGAEEVVDAQGKLRYRQLCAILSRPPPPPSSTTTEAAMTTSPLTSSATASMASSSSPSLA